MKLVSEVFAAGITNPVLPEKVGSGEGGPIVANLISAAVGIILFFGFIMALIHLTLGAVRWITASGDKTHLQNAQERITQAIVGLIVLAAIWAVFILVSNFIGIPQGLDVFSLPLPTLK